ncbi:MAG TPA: hypothetical protein VFW62_02840, partial [bacterium]|nr:hypothetical protein [bacterium]
AFLSILFLCFALAAPSAAPAQGHEVERQAAGLQEQGPALQAFLKRSREGQADPQFVSDVLRGAKALEDQGLPAEPYLLKANEGLAKRVPPKRMTPALEATGARTRNAATLVDEAVKRGATASPESRRQAILQFQSELMTGRSRADLEKSIDAGFAKQAKPSLSELAEEASGPRKGGKVEKNKVPAGALEHPAGSEKKPSKVSPPAAEKPSKKAPTLEKEKGKSKPSLQKPERSKTSAPKEKGNHFNGRSGGKGKGK